MYSRPTTRGSAIGRTFRLFASSHISTTMVTTAKVQQRVGLVGCNSRSVHSIRIMCGLTVNSLDVYEYMVNHHICSCRRHQCVPFVRCLLYRATRLIGNQNECIRERERERWVVWLEQWIYKSIVWGDAVFKFDINGSIYLLFGFLLI